MLALETLENEMLPPLPGTPLTPVIGTGKAGPGRPKGLANKTTALLKDAILKAAERAGGGGKGGLEAFLLMQANKENNQPFMALLAKVLPLQVAGDGDGPLEVVIFKTFYDGAEAQHVSTDPYMIKQQAARAELAAAREKLVEMERTVPLLPGPDLD
jgi:hypothetical protein